MSFPDRVPNPTNQTPVTDSLQRKEQGLTKKSSVGSFLLLDLVPRVSDAFWDEDHGTPAECLVANVKW